MPCEYKGHAHREIVYLPVHLFNEKAEEGLRLCFGTSPNRQKRKIAKFKQLVA